MGKQNISTTLDRDLVKKLDQVVEDTERTRSWLINKAIGAYLEELEDLRVARQRLGDKRLTPSALRKAIDV